MARWKKTTITIVVFSKREDKFDPGSIQDIANYVEHEVGHGNIQNVTHKAATQEELEEEGLDEEEED